MVQQYKAKVLHARQLTHDVRELTFEVLEPGDWNYKAGQYISFTCPRDDNPKPIARLYSLSSHPAQKGVAQITYNYVGGPGTKFLQSLKEGQDVDFKGPFGNFLLKNNDRDVLFAATGTGIAPFRSMLHDQLEQGSKRNFALLWGVRQSEDLYYQAEFNDMAKQYPNFKFYMTLSQEKAPESEWKGLHGRITAHVKDIYTNTDNVDAYLCGSDYMIKDMTELLMSLGQCNVHREKYF
ncbi:MAG: hypothetical protein COV45_00960 [Deltaproteobacteria bacterium CG11_big_fil_rev_8_21_14_0_20_47_16]|nr:MAG: hypothetical protein COV45_00960 [Deltaproteobacteria bacterium CG11_big_fil_rev_8_21_14_0_20_47_16]